VCSQIVSLTEHDGMGSCICTMDENGSLERDGDNMPSPHYGCPVAHTSEVGQVEFSDDGAQVIFFFFITLEPRVE